MNNTNIPPSVTLCEDGKYRWIYELKMFTNPAVFLTVFKVLALTSLLPFLIVVISDGFKNILGSLKMLVLTVGILFVLCIVGYVITALLYSGKYCILFTMDEEGIMHAQQAKQFGKAQLVGMITAMAGASAGKPGTVGTGILTASKSELYSRFSAVKTIKVIHGQNLIKLDYPTSHNQIYCEDDAMDFVEQYIRERCTRIKREIES